MLRGSSLVFCFLIFEGFCKKKISTGIDPGAKVYFIGNIEKVLKNGLYYNLFELKKQIAFMVNLKKHVTMLLCRLLYIAVVVCSNKFWRLTMIGIIGAMPLEVENILMLMTEVKSYEKSKIKYHAGKINEVLCVVAFSGVGKVNAAVCSQTMVLEFGVKKIINVGVAGGLLEEMHTGDIVISSGAVQHDCDTTALGDPLGLISTINIIKLPCSCNLKNSILKVLFGSSLKEQLWNQEGENKNLKQNKEVPTNDSKSYGIIDTSCGTSKVFEGIIASGDKFVCEKNDLITIRNNFNAIACDMETASIAQVCYLNDVEFLSIRTISDNVNGDNSNMDYENFKQKSAKAACEVLYKVVPAL